MNPWLPLGLVLTTSLSTLQASPPDTPSPAPIAAIPLDSGNVNGGNLRVLPTGKVLFVFSPGGTPGRYGVVVHTPLEQHLLEFYVVDPSHHPRQQRH